MLFCYIYIVAVIIIIPIMICCACKDLPKPKMIEKVVDISHYPSVDQIVNICRFNKWDIYAISDGMAIISIPEYTEYKFLQFFPKAKDI